MTVALSKSALSDLTDILRRIHADKPLAALKMREEFSAKFLLLASQPGIGTPGEDGETRELVVRKSYRIVYRMKGDVLWIARIVHTAMRWPAV